MDGGVAIPGLSAEKSDASVVCDLPESAIPINSIPNNIFKKD
jgi:hypothetical protein